MLSNVLVLFSITDSIHFGNHRPIDRIYVHNGHPPPSFLKGGGLRLKTKFQKGDGGLKNFWIKGVAFPERRGENSRGEGLDSWT